MSHIAHVTDMIALPAHRQLLFADYTSIAALGPNGIDWVTERVSSDGITIEGVTENRCRLTSWCASYQKYVKIEVDLDTGAIVTYDIEF